MQGLSCADLTTFSGDAFWMLVVLVDALSDDVDSAHVSPPCLLVSCTPLHNFRYGIRIVNKLANPAHKYTARVKLVDGSEHVIRPDVTEVFRPADAPSLVLARQTNTTGELPRRIYQKTRRSGTRDYGSAR